MEYGTTGKIKNVHIRDPNNPEAKRLMRQVEGLDLPEGKIIPNGDGTIRIDLSSVDDIKAARRVTNEAVGAIGESGVTGYISKRLLRIRAGIAGFHPIERRIQKAGESLTEFYTNFNKKRDEKIRKGSEAPETKATA